MLGEAPLRYGRPTGAATRTPPPSPLICVRRCGYRIRVAQPSSERSYPVEVVERAYWSSRVGRGPQANPDIRDLARSLTLAVAEMAQRDFFQEWYGYDCIDAGYVKGKANVDITTHADTVLRYQQTWPLPDPLIEPPDGAAIDDEMGHHIELEDQIFDLIEFFHDHISAGVEDAGYYHSYNQCGWHFSQFDAAPARELFRSRLNAVLRNYRSGFQLTIEGEIERSAPPGLDSLLDAPLRTSDVDIQSRVLAAISVYRNRHRSVEDQRDAVRNLFDVLEKIRPLVKLEMLKGDERDLFNIANNFSVRHLSEIQKGNYDGPLWLSWMFYVNLATIHLLTRLQPRIASSAESSNAAI